MQEGCKIRRTYGIFGYTRRDKLFIFVGVGVFHPLIARLVQVSGNPRDACWSFARHAGIAERQAYRPWTRKEQQRLLDLIAIQPVHEVTLMLRRSPASVRSMLQRLGATAKMGQDWFTKYTLAEALHVPRRRCAEMDRPRLAAMPDGTDRQADETDY